MKFKFKLLIMWVAVMAIIIFFLWLRPFNEILLLALVFVLGILGVMLYTRKHKDIEVKEPEITQ